MTRTNQIVGTSLVAVTTLLSLAAPARTSLADSPSDVSTPVPAKLIKIQEIRRVTLAKYDPIKPAIDFHRPAIALMFSVTPPTGKQFIRAEQPRTVTASDSFGTDLSAIEPGFLGTKDYVELLQTYGKSTNKFTFTLAAPTRGAKTMSLKTDFVFWAFDGVRDYTFAPTAEPMPLPPALFDGQKFTVEIRPSDNGTQLMIRPGSAIHHVEDVELVYGGDVLENLGAMWNDEIVSYDFQTIPKPGMQIRARVRVGVTRHPCSVDLSSVELP